MRFHASPLRGERCCEKCSRPPYPPLALGSPPCQEAHASGHNSPPPVCAGAEERRPWLSLWRPICAVHKARTYLRHDVVAPRSALCLQAPSNGVGQPLLSQHVPSSSTFIDKNRPAPSNSSEPDLFGFVVGVVRLHVWAHSTRRSLNDLKADVRLAGKVQRQAVRFHAPRQQSNHVDRGKARQTKGRTLAHALLQVMGSKPS